AVADRGGLPDGLDASTLIGARDRPVILLGFAGMLRRSEVAALALADVDESPERLSVTVRHSQTHPAGEGAVVAILPGLLGPMSGQAVAMVIARAAERAGLTGRYRGHSLRRGGAPAPRTASTALVRV